MIILEENLKWHLEAFASELFIYLYGFMFSYTSHFGCLLYLFIEKATKIDYRGKFDYFLIHL